MNEIPDWLESFRITIELESEDQLFDTWQHDIENLKFNHPIGAQIGTELLIDNVLYEILGVQIYPHGMLISESDKPMKSLQLMIIVKELSNK